jgi:hypothetical protein
MDILSLLYVQIPNSLTKINFITPKQKEVGEAWFHISRPNCSIITTQQRGGSQRHARSMNKDRIRRRNDG